MELPFILNELYIKGNTESVDLYFSDNYLAYSNGKTYHGRPFVKRFIKQLRSCISNIKISKIEIIEESEQMIVWQRTLNGVHHKNFRGIPASNKRIKWVELVVSKIHNQSNVEEWISSDLAFQLMINQRKN